MKSAGGTVVERDGRKIERKSMTRKIGNERSGEGQKKKKIGKERDDKK